MNVKQPRRRLAPAARIELILEEALRLFAESHYSTVSIRDIAEACGINPALIYYYFENKDALLRRVLGHAIEALQEGYNLDEAVASNPAAELDAYLGMHVPIAKMLIRMVKIMADYSASAVRDSATDHLITEFYAREQAFLEDCLHRGISAKIFKPVAVTMAARMISLQLDGIFYAAQARGDERIPEDIANLQETLRTFLGRI